MAVTFDPATGEVLELDTAQVRAVAAEYVSVQLLTLGLGDVTNPEPVYIVAWDRLVPEPRLPGLKINVVVK